jgi:MinD-like ATPase involved in chromosome partitioning or flagellar assembly
LRPALDAAPGLEVSAHCLAADQVLAAVEARQVEAVVLAWGLHRLSEDVLLQLERGRLPVVLLVPDTDAPRWQAQSASVLPMHVEPGTLCDTIRAAVRGERFRPTPSSGARPVEPTAPPEETDLQVIVVAGAAGSPGRTTVAINLATALGAVAPTVLIDADFASPAVAAYVNADPSRNICTLAHAVREGPQVWRRAIDEELQLLHPRSRGARVLCGMPKREMRSSVSPAALERIIAELAHQYRYVIVDIGSELLGLEAVPTLHRAALLAAHHVLIVTMPDLVGLWHARTTLSQLGGLRDLGGTQHSMVINRHDSRHHHTREEIEWHLATPTSVVVPYDYAALRRSAADQFPVVVDASSRAGGAMLALAERVHNGRVRLPPPGADPVSAPWWHFLDRMRFRRTGRSAGPSGRKSASPRDRDRSW